MTYEYGNPNEYYCENCNRQQSMEDLRDIETSVYNMQDYGEARADFYRPCPPPKPWPPCPPCPPPFPPFPPCPKPCPPCPPPFPPCPKPCPPCPACPLCPPPKPCPPCPKPKDKICIRLVAVEACLNQCLPEKPAFGVDDLKQALASFEENAAFTETETE